MVHSLTAMSLFTPSCRRESSLSLGHCLQNVIGPHGLAHAFFFFFFTKTVGVLLTALQNTGTDRHEGALRGGESTKGAEIKCSIPMVTFR